MEKKSQAQWAIAKVLREAREASGMTQVQLADFAELSLSFISAVERGAMGMGLSTFFQISTVLHVSPTELMRRIEAEILRGPQQPVHKQGRPARRKKPQKVFLESFSQETAARL